MLNVARHRRRQVESGQQGEGLGRSMRLKPGKNYIRVFKFKHKVTKRDYDIKLYKTADKDPKVGETAEELSRTYFAHFRQGVGPTMCFLATKDCEICSDARDMMNTADGNDQRAGKMLRRQPRDILNVVNMDDAASGMQQLELSPQPFERLLDELFAKLDDDISEENIFGCKGRDFIIDWDKTNSDIGKRYSVSLRDKERSVALPTKLKDDVKDLYKAYALDPQDSPAPPVNEEPEARQVSEGGDDFEKGLDEEHYIGKTVKFTEGEAEVEGIVSKVEDSKLTVNVEGRGKDLDGTWDLDMTEVEIVEEVKKKTTNRRRKK